MRYENKVVIITGGSKGIGEGCVRSFAGASAKIVFCARGEPEGQALLRDFENKSRHVSFIPCDVRNLKDLKHVVDETLKIHGRLDCLINNAGWHPPHQSIDDFSVDDFRSLFELNVVSMFAACKFALPSLRQTRGNIINLSSLVGTMGQRLSTTYVATKGAITAFTKALAIDEAANGVRVNSVSPGNIYTPLWQEAIDAATDPEGCRREGEAAQWLGRMGSIEEVGNLCLYMAAEATFSTGVDYIISGGAELGYGRKSNSQTDLD
jgi:NAD(P)-dependent dehydrogenase (short-subunit alcohol dehydrogenase family)